MTGVKPLPYRTDSLALASWLEARARGRSAEQLRLATDAPKGVEGTAVAAAALGFVQSAGGPLTDVGEQFVLATDDERRRLVAEAVASYPPYGSLLEALRARDEAETEVRWIEAWWSTRGYGSSESNRREGAAAFGRLAEFAGIAEYIPGRRGRPTRLRWLQADLSETPVPVRRVTDPSLGAISGSRPAAPDLFSEAADAEPQGALRPAAPHLTSTAAQQTDPDPSPTASRGGSASRLPAAHLAEDSDGAATPDRSAEAPLNRITLPLESGAVARIEVPLRLPRADKRRLLDLLHLLITED